MLYFRYTKIFGGSKPNIPKFFYTKTIYPLYRKKNFGGSAAPSRPLIAAPMPLLYLAMNFFEDGLKRELFLIMRSDGTRLKCVHPNFYNNDLSLYSKAFLSTFVIILDFVS